ncbi:MULTISPECIES: hypothetical protein [Pseudobacillus]|uniref:hypothetical protein n=1 Tax=Pseudobacillus TaxID=108525 RepID=UPI00387A44BD
MIVQTLDLPKKEQNLHDYCSKQLKKLWNDKSFYEDYQSFLRFYYLKLQKIITIRSEREEIADEFYDFISDLVYQGFYLGLELINHPEVQIGDQFLLQKDGVIREQVYGILTGAAGDLERIVSHSESMKFQTKLNENYPTIDRVINQLKIDASCYGCFYALLNERKQRKLNVQDEEGKGAKGLLYQADDLFFATPQTYFACVAVSPFSEVWELNIWSGVETRSRRIGEIHVAYFDVDNLNNGFQQLPYYQGYEAMLADSPKIIAKALLDEKLPEWEKLFHIDRISESILNRNNIVADNLHVTVGSGTVSEIKYYKYKKEIDSNE